MSTKRKAEGHSRSANRPRIMKSGDSRTDSERDSGFSDASSEHTSTMDTTDSEDSPRPAAGPKGPQGSGSGPQTSQLTVVGGSYSNLSPMIIMNNVVLKQPGDNPPALKPWGFSPAVEVVQPVVQQPQVVFLQPVVSRQASPASKEASSRHRRPKKYLPILKSYPKIAPHPGDSSSSSGRGTASSSSSSASSTSSSSSDSKRSSTLTSAHREHCQREKQQKSLSAAATNSSSSTPSLPVSPGPMSPLLPSRVSLHSVETSSSSSSPVMEKPLPAVSQCDFNTSLSLTQSTVSISQTVPVPWGDNQESSSSGDSDADTKRKRFCNTYNILSKSGLLDIALRTKELHRQNRRTQSDLDQLKEHTDLFLQAVLSGDPSVCLKLQARLQEEDRERERAAQTSLKAD